MPSSSLVLGVGALFLSSVFSPVTAVKPATTNYALIDSFKGDTFFDNFDFWTGPDPTIGFVDYKDNVTAQNLGLTSVSGGAAFMRVDDKHTYAPPPNSNGRPSVRISSKKTYTKGLFIADIAHMPGSICGVWPAFWSFGPNWPNSGEIDILEGVDLNRKNKVSLHSGDNCKVSPTIQSGTANGNDCAVSSSGSGCAVDDVSTASYGDGFNAVNGGVYAMEWTSTSIKVWFFPRAIIPLSIKLGAPDVSTFGVPVAYFTGCDFDSHFANHQIVFDTTFCGVWAGQYDYATTTCPSAKDGWAGCVVDVGSNPSWFTDAYWEINSVEIYQQKTTPSGTSSSVSSTTTKVSSTSSSISITSSSVSSSSSSASSSISSPSSVSSSVASSTLSSSVSSTQSTSSSIYSTPTSSSTSSSGSSTWSSTSVTPSSSTSSKYSVSSSSAVRSASSVSSSSWSSTSSTVSLSLASSLATTTSSTYSIFSVATSSSASSIASSSSTSSTSSYSSSSSPSASSASTSCTSCISSSLVVYPTLSSSTSCTSSLSTSSAYSSSSASTSCTSSLSKSSAYSAPPSSTSCTSSLSSSSSTYAASSSSTSCTSSISRSLAYSTSLASTSCTSGVSSSSVYHGSSTSTSCTSSHSTTSSSTESVSTPCSTSSSTTIAPYLYNATVTYGAYLSNASSASKKTITTVITTSYIGICSTGYTTSTITQTVTYCPAEQTKGALPPGFTTSVTVCTVCAEKPTTVTLTLPTATATKAVEYPACYGPNCKAHAESYAPYTPSNPSPPPSYPHLYSTLACSGPHCAAPSASTLMKTVQVVHTVSVVLVPLPPSAPVSKLYPGSSSAPHSSGAAYGTSVVPAYSHNATAAYTKPTTAAASASAKYTQGVVPFEGAAVGRAGAGVVAVLVGMVGWLAIL